MMGSLVIFVVSFVAVKSTCFVSGDSCNITIRSPCNPDGSWCGPDFKERVGTRVNLSSAMHEHGAVCLDGTVPVFYWRPGVDDGVHKFHIFFEGGGWCAGNDEPISSTMDTCQHRATTELGSSLSYPPTANYDNTYLSTDATINPLSHAWNAVYVKYCDGASFSGNNDTVLKGDIDLHFRGWRILNGVFDELKRNYHWNAATDVLISGCSAGGLTTWLHSDYIYETYVMPLGARFLGMPDSGWFPKYEGATKYVSGMSWNFVWQNTSEAMNQECMMHNAKETSKCIFAEETAKYLKVKMFPIQSRFDYWQTLYQLKSSNATLINTYADNMTKVFKRNYANNSEYGQKRAAFFDSCHHHCGEWDSIIIDGMKASQAQFEFYYGNNTHDRFWFQDETYPCHSCCFDTCSSESCALSGSGMTTGSIVAIIVTVLALIATGVAFGYYFCGRKKQKTGYDQF
eukprot:513394_1